jgi:hypothetical protein
MYVYYVPCERKVYFNTCSSFTFSRLSLQLVFEVHTMITIKNMIFWDVLQCSSINAILAYCFLLAP